MNHQQKQVQDFHLKFNIPINEKPTSLSLEEKNLRLGLIEEELAELAEAYASDDQVLIADALADLLYVTYGAAVTSGIDLKPVFEEVHKTNMLKDGGKLSETGKLLKPEGWQPPNLRPIIDRQMK